MTASNHSHAITGAIIDAANPPTRFAFNFDTNDICRADEHHEGIIRGELLDVYDSNLASSHHLTSKPHYCLTPLMVEPGLVPLIWPILPAHFHQHYVAAGRALAVHASSRRVQQLMMALGLTQPMEDIVLQAEHVIVWMRDVKSGVLQYVNVEPIVACAAYRARHTLYINPPLHTQHEWINALCDDLGIVRGTQNDGGDIEVFLVRHSTSLESHVTPWHWDAQINFTIQLSGQKKWLLKPRNASNPLTNFHPRSSNRAAVACDVAVHRFCGVDETMQDYGDVESVTLRAGSVLFLPAGTWHCVETCGDDNGDEDCWSVNLSMTGERWIDTLQQRLLPSLLFGDESWRQRCNFHHDDKHVLRHRILSLSKELLHAANDDALMSEIAAGMRSIPSEDDEEKSGRFNKKLCTETQLYRKARTSILIVRDDNTEMSEDIVACVYGCGFGRIHESIDQAVGSFGPTQCFKFNVPRQFVSALRVVESAEPGSTVILGDMHKLPIAVIEWLLHVKLLSLIKQ